MRSSGRKKLLGLFTELLFPGGIQRVSCSMAALMVRYANDYDMDYALISLNDPKGRHDLRIDGISFSVEGTGRNKTRFLRSAIGAASGAVFLHIGHPNLAPLGMLLKTVRPRVKYAVSAHGIEVWDSLSVMRRFGLRCADVVTVPSNFTAIKLVSSQRLAASRVRVLPWGTDFASVFAPDTAARPKLPRGKILLSVARLAKTERYKGIASVIRAMTSVVKAVPDAYYVIVGDGDDRPELQRMVNSLNLSGHVIFAGLRSDRELAQYYNSCDIFVMPSSKEGFGLVYVEAMAFGKVVVASREGATPEIVVDGQTGILVDPNRPEELETSIIHLLENDSVRESMGKAGRTRVEINYSLPQFQKHFAALLSNIVNPSPSLPAWPI